MSKFSFAQLEGLWIQGGGDPRYAPYAAGVAMAESGGDSQATGRNPGSTDVGLWQINGPGNGDPKFYDPLTNVKEAIRQSHNGVDWKPWCTAYTDGACGTKGGSYSLSNSPAGRALRAAGGSVPPSFSNTSGGTQPVVSSAGVSSAYNSATCAWGVDLGTFGTPQSFFGFSLPSLSAKVGFCIISKTQVRALLGGILVGAGAMVTLWGTTALIAYAFKKTGALDSIVGATKSVPGVGKTGSSFGAKTKASVAKTTKTRPARNTNVNTTAVPPPGPKPKRGKKPPMGQNNPRTEKKYRESFERGEGE